MKILLIQPSIPKNSKGVTGTICLEPLALEIIAKPLVEKHEIQIVDLKLENNLEAILMDFQPNLAGITAYTMEVPNALKISKKIKTFNHNIITVIGGLHATLFPKTFLNSSFDYLVRGRGEFIFKELVGALRKKQPIYFSSKLINLRSKIIPKLTNEGLWDNIDENLLPARALVSKYRAEYHLGLMDSCYSLKTTDGCPFKCSFCVVWKYYQGKYLLRSPEAIVREIENIEGKNIIVVDDNFLSHKARSYSLARLLLKKGIKKNYFIQSRPDTIVRNPELIELWREVGLSLVALGIDGFREKELQDWNKKSNPEKGLKAAEILNNLGIQSLGEFIIDTDYQKQDFKLLRQYIYRSKLTLIQLSILTPLPGTDLYEKRKDEIITTDLSKFNVDYPILPTKLPLWKFFDAIANVYWFTAIRPAAILRRMKLGNYSFWQGIKGFYLISAIITHYKMESWKQLFKRLIH